LFVFIEESKRVLGATEKGRNKAKESSMIGTDVTVLVDNFDYHDWWDDPHQS